MIKILQAQLGHLQGVWDAKVKEVQNALANRTLAEKRERELEHKLKCTQTELTHLRKCSAPCPASASSADEMVLSLVSTASSASLSFASQDSFASKLSLFKHIGRVSPLSALSLATHPTQTLSWLLTVIECSQRNLNLPAAALPPGKTRPDV